MHSHTWYANFAGHLASLMGDIPHVLTAHSLEPMRPWKAEQLGGGYRVSSWVEKTAYEAADAVVAVSAGMREDILRSYPSVDPERVKVVHNGIDSQLWQRERDEDVVRSHGIDPDRPSVIFVGRITRQKGLPYLLRAAAELPPDALVLLAGALDTPEIKARWSTIDGLRQTRMRVVGADDAARTRSSRCSAARPSSSAPRSTSPSASSTSRRWPASPVVATATGGIPEVVVHGETGWLVPIDQVQDGTGTPSTRTGSSPTSPLPLTDAVSDPTGPTGWVSRAVVGPWSRSPGVDRRADAPGVPRRPQAPDAVDSDSVRCVA